MQHQNVTDGVVRPSNSLFNNPKETKRATKVNNKIWDNSVFEANPSPGQALPGYFKSNNVITNQSSSFYEGPHDNMPKVNQAPLSQPVVGNWMDSGNARQPPSDLQNIVEDSSSPELSLAAWEADLKSLIRGGMIDEGLQKLAPSQGGLVRCYIKRTKGFFGKTSAFQMYLEDGETFLLAARRRKKSKVSSYIISKSLEELTRDSHKCVAKLKANFVGTEYVLWGRTPGRNIKKGFASQDLCIGYTPPEGMGGPRCIHLAHPAPGSNWRLSQEDENLGQYLEMAKSKTLPPSMEKYLSLLCTLPPIYDEITKGYTLDFHDRKIKSSAKNLQLVAWDHNSRSQKYGMEVILQFAKVGDDVYALDFSYPMSVLTAFAVALSAMDSKLCYAV